MDSDDPTVIWDITPSEIDRELDSEDSSLYGDDSDADPTYNPNEPSTSFQSPFSRPRPNLNINNSSDSDSDIDMPLPRPRPVPPQPRPVPPHSRQVLSDSSDSDVQNDNSLQVTWEPVDENEGFDFVHNFSFHELPGPKHCPPIGSKPIAYFNLFFTTALIDVFLTETNRYANQTIESKGDNISPRSIYRSWQPIIAKEIRAFIAVLLNMGLNRKPTIKAYWSKSPSQSYYWFRKMFTRERFESILCFFHLVDNSKLPKTNQDGYDATQKFQPLIDHCNRLFRHFYTGHQQLSIDESLIGTKNRTSLLQYLPNKHHHRWGIKLWVLCDAISKYCLSFYCYKGAKTDNDKKEIKTYGLGFIVVNKLMSACNYINKGYHVFCDNFFSSLTLVRNLYANNTFLSGTIRKMRKGLPDGVKGQLKVGEKRYFKHENTCVLAYRQKKTQKKPVLIVSSKPDVGDINITKTRQGRNINETKPQMIHEYNKYMGGVDHFDMMLYSYLDERRTVKFWKKVVFNLFARMTLNAYVIYKENCQQHNEKPMSRYQFIVGIIEDIETEWMAEKNIGAGGNGGGDGIVGRPRAGRFASLIKLPGNKVKTCWVCSNKGTKCDRSNRKRSRTVCSLCQEGCHPMCLLKHVCN